jgi:prepilin-type N-terminal cleavage/methylation domain-containing protein/prepilin-type processing-associated H-X9-DG protein
MITSRPVRGFTLIELLTVIAIIGILAAIIIPVVGSVRTKARAVQCSSNLRQMAMAAQLYAGDNRDLIVPWRTPAAPAPQVYFTDALAPYINARKPPSGAVDGTVFLCPVEKPNAAGETVQRVGGFNTRYSCNIHICWDGVGNPGADPTHYQRRKLRVSQIEYPSRTFLFVDLYGNTGGGNWMVPRLVYPHDERVNVAFLDGHVESRNKAQMEHYGEYSHHVFWRGFKWSAGADFRLD